MRRCLSAVLTAALLCGAGTVRAAPTLAERAHDVLRRYCADCHGTRLEKPPLNVLDRAVLLQPRKRPYVVAGSPETSLLWQRVERGDMPPEDAKDRPTAAERQALRDWIAAGAPFPGRPARGFRGEKDTLAAIRAHLLADPPAARERRRYFTLAPLYNNPDVSDDDLRLYRAALAKLLNSLSWQPAVVVPRAVDAEGTVYCVDLRRLGWDDAAWDEVLKAYPYGLRHDTDRDPALRGLYREVTELSGADVPCVRADWFVTAAAQPPLYHRLLGLPSSARDLERRLGIDFAADFARHRLARAGLTTSGVSRQNRVVERQRTAFGAYWRSYDFRTSGGAGDVLRLPLGPDFAGNPFAPRHAFRPAGGEIVFNLPNGLQGYLLVDAKDRRIDRAPVAIVRDGGESAGTPEVVNGLSCIRCHRHGVVAGFRDVVRAGHALRGEPALEVERLYRPQEEMDELLRRDETRFLQALARAAGPILKAPVDGGRDVRDVDEPVGALARFYLRDLDARQAACELGLADVRELQEAVRRSRELRALRLGPLAEGEKIKRETWEQLDVTSAFQEAARLLDLGTPQVELKGK